MKEEIYCRNYRDLPDLESHLQEFLEQYYNRNRLRSALNYRTRKNLSSRAGRATPKICATLRRCVFLGIGNLSIR
jgi:hypothetical protein